MLLLDAVYINNSGGKVLLDYLILSLEKSGKEVFYLLDSRVQGKIPSIKKTQNVVYLEASLMKRALWYYRNAGRFTSVFCFGNLPPLMKPKCNVFTYLHQQLFLLPNNSIPSEGRTVILIKRFIFNILRANTDVWVVQSENMKKMMVENNVAGQSAVKVLPFFPPLHYDICIRIPGSFVYVSNAPPHKNHLRLIDAFCKFYDTYRQGTLTLTVIPEIENVYSYIEEKQAQGYPIKNIGFVGREALQKIYSESEYLIYPSLAESFGLGLVEGIECGCKVIGADLPYTYAVCEPSLTFNPMDTDSIFDALSLSLQENLPPSKAKVTNRIDELIDLLN